jgi:hypothetical protein
MKRIFRFTVLAVVLACAAFSFVSKSCANGDISADVPVPPAEKRVVRRAPIKRPVKKKKAAVRPRVKTSPTIPRPTSLERGTSLLEQERYTQARPWLQKAVQEERRNPWAWYWYGVVHERMGEFQQAQFFYTKAMELDPSFSPFSRVVTWPDDGERKPLWDPLRPARVYPIPASSHGLTTIPPDAPEAAVRPGRPAVDPDIPKVPVYVPPEPSSALLPGNATQPPVYVPPPVKFEEEQE